MEICSFPAAWPRRETFDHYRRNPCTYSLTQAVDVTALRLRSRQGGPPLVPSLLHAICRAVNRLPALRMTLFEGQPAYWREVCPAYTVFHPETETFSALWTSFVPDPAEFVAAYQADLAAYGSQPAFFPKGPPPSHAINISVAPWLDFSAFNLAFAGADDYLLPVFTVGRFTEHQGRVTLPLAVQVNHAACDGYHVARWFEVLSDELNALG